MWREYDITFLLFLPRERCLDDVCLCRSHQKTASGHAGQFGFAINFFQNTARHGDVDLSYDIGLAVGNWSQ